MKLHLGCYNKKIYGFTNVDIRPEVNPDVVDDAFILTKFRECSADLILSVHMLEHLSQNDAKIALRRWYRILKSKGVLRLAVPDLEAAASLLLLTKNIELVRTIYWGSGKHEYDFHKTGWVYEGLKKDLKEIGFKKVKRYNWWETEHAYIDDYSQSYWPRKDIKYNQGKPSDINGINLSLNVEARK